MASLSKAFDHIDHDYIIRQIFELDEEEQVYVSVSNPKRKLCIDNDCHSLSRFGHSNMHAIHCKKHKKKHEVDLISKRCVVNNCNVSASFGLPYKRAVHCKKHQKTNEIDLKRKMCAICGDTSANPKYKPHCASCHWRIQNQCTVHI